MNVYIIAILALCQLVQCQYYSTNNGIYRFYNYSLNRHVESVSQVSKSDHEQVYSPWYITNNCTSTKKSICQTQDLFYGLKCEDNEGGLLELGYCLSYTSSNGKYSIGKCPYVQLNRPDITEDGYIKLPNNASKVNNHICYPMNRTEFMCHQCIPGFGPSLSSMRFQCSNCTNAWNGPLLYLLVEYVPITIIYLVILFSRTNITSAPMTFLILYSQAVVYIITYNFSDASISLFSLRHGKIIKSLLVVYGAMNLELLHYIVPPFCISNKLQIIHIVLLGCLASFYPLFLVSLTWFCVELHDHNFRLLVMLWKPFHRCWIRLRNGLNIKHDLIDVFASFFLLSYSKIIYHSMLLLGCCSLAIFDASQSGNITYESAKCFDPSMSCNNRQSLKFTIPAVVVIIVFNILPALLLILYPIRVFRIYLSKCKLDGIAITVFVDRFHGCYIDGLNGGRDLRSFSGLYFFITFYCMISDLLPIVVWIWYVLVFLTLALIIAYVKPYRK